VTGRFEPGPRQESATPEPREWIRDLRSPIPICILDDAHCPQGSMTFNNPWPTGSPGRSGCNETSSISLRILAGPSGVDGCGLPKRWLVGKVSLAGREISAAEGPRAPAAARWRRNRSATSRSLRNCRPAARPARSAAGFWVTEQPAQRRAAGLVTTTPQRTSEIHARQHCLPTRRAGVAGSCCRGTSLTVRCHGAAGETQRSATGRRRPAGPTARTPGLPAPSTLW
jgi:hypothetical protein